MPQQTKTIVEFPRVIQENLLLYSLNIVPSCISIHQNNIALGHDTGITVLSSIPLDSKITLSVSNEFAKRHIFKLNDDYSDIMDDVQNIKYTANYIVASNSINDIVVIDHIKSTHFQISSSGMITSFDVLEDHLAVIYNNKSLHIWDLNQQRLQNHIKLKKGELVKFQNNSREIILIEYGNVVHTIDYKTGGITSKYKLKSYETVIDIIGSSKPIIIYKDLSSYYIRPSLGCTNYAQLQLGVIDCVSGRKLSVEPITKYPVVDAEVSDINFIAIISGTRLFIVKK